MRYLKHILFSALTLLAFQANAQVEAVLSIAEESVENGSYHFSIMVHTSENSDGPLYLGNADFALSYNSSLFTNPTLEKMSNTTNLFNNEGESNSVNLLTGLNLSTQLNSSQTGNSVTGDVLIVNLNGTNPGSVADLNSSVARVNELECIHKIGEFRITGLNDSNTTDAGLAWVSGGLVPTDVYTYNETTLQGEQVSLLFEENGYCRVALPIALESFQAWNVDGNYNQVVWKTATEQNSDYFEVQKSNNGVDFVRIGAVNAAGTSSGALAYDFQDNAPFPGITYYRLKMVDRDGSYELSDVVAVKTKLENTIDVYPVPVLTEMNIVYDGNNAGDITINVVDAMGKMMMTRLENAVEGFNQFNLDLAQLPAGTYFVNIIDERGTTNVRPFVKK